MSVPVPVRPPDGTYPRIGAPRGLSPPCAFAPDREHLRGLSEQCSLASVNNPTVVRFSECLVEAENLRHGITMRSDRTT